MKRKILLSLVCLIMALTAMTQVRFGVEAGLNIVHAYDTERTNPGFNVGVSGEYGFGRNWYIDGILKFSQQTCGDKYQSSIIDPFLGTIQLTGPKIKTRFTPYYLTLPVHIGYRFALSDKARLSVSAGPMIGVGLFGLGYQHFYSSAFSSGEHREDIDNVFKNEGEDSYSTSRFEYGADFRLSFELLNHYTLSVNYNLVHLGGENQTIDNVGILAINLGYRF